MFTTHHHPIIMLRCKGGACKDVLFCVILALLISSSAAAPPTCKGGACKNVLYFLTDDMRADLGLYGLPVHTPNLDELAARGLTFEHAYCQLSVCSPSRQSFMTSVRPDRNQVWNFITHNPNTTQATPGYFKDAGYLALGLGKTFHELYGAWNADKYWSTDVKPYFPYAENECPIGNAGGGHCTEEDDAIYDYSLRQKAIEYLGFAAEVRRNTSRPFYMMVGFRDPHAPWAAPQRMYDLYNESDIAVATHKTLDPSQPLIAWSEQLVVQLQNGTSFPFSPTEAVPDWVERDQRHAYYAAVSYVDEHVGAILSKLDAEALTSQTIVAFHADHGYQLGEHGIWEKKSNFDLAVRVPLIISVPDKPHAAGLKTSAIVELVDVMPTLLALAGLPHPVKADGTDLSRMFDDPTAPSPKAPAAYHQYPACGMTGIKQTRMGCNQVEKDQFDYMGYSVRTDEWRYTLWVPWDQKALRPLWDAPEREQELYAHTGDDSSDMDRWENHNLAERQPLVVAKLRKQVRDFFSTDGSVGDAADEIMNE
jgi:iduronate 2-sulfatase